MAGESGRRRGGVWSGGTSPGRCGSDAHMERPAGNKDMRWDAGQSSE